MQTCRTEDVGAGPGPHFSSPCVCGWAFQKQVPFRLPAQCGVKDWVLPGVRPEPGMRKTLKCLWKEVRKKGREGGRKRGRKERRKAKGKEGREKKFLVHCYDG